MIVLLHIGRQIMAKSLSKVRRRQLDIFFGKLQNRISEQPKSGWIRLLRIALGMSAADLASRLGVIRQRIDRLERDEIEGRVTLESMSKVADALNCEFVYFLIPRRSLQDTLEEQALRAATKIANEVEHSMKLEEQGTNEKFQKSLINEIAHELIAKRDRRIWKAD